MSTSETVQAAQRLLAERERVGLAKYGTTVDRADLQAGDWLKHAIEEASDLLLYLIRLQQTIPRACPAGPAPEFIVSPIVCPGTPDAHTLTLKIGVQSFRISGGLDFDTRGDAEWMASQLRNALESISQPATKALPTPAAAPEDADRAAYLARWANAPEWAQWLAQDGDGWCFWFSGKPYQHEILGWCLGHPGQNKTAGDNILGRVACEPRPRAEGER
jgi:hypothetical protein